MKQQFPFLQPLTPLRLVLAEQTQLGHLAQKEATAVLGRLSLLRAEDLEQSQAPTAATVGLAVESTLGARAQAAVLEQQQLDKAMLVESSHLLIPLHPVAAVAQEHQVGIQTTAETAALDQIHTALGQRRLLRA
jgi:hypothetical protein